MIAHILICTTDLVMPLTIPTKEANAKIQTLSVTTEVKINKCFCYSVHHDLYIPKDSLLIHLFFQCLPVFSLFIFVVKVIIHYLVEFYTRLEKINRSN